ncbi:MAG: TIGR03086 family metal-binding protein [Actinomycetota bacterium]
MITTNTPTSGHLDDPRSTFDRAITVAEGIIVAVHPDQLTDPTPCTEMDVRTLLAHLVGVLDRVAALGNDEDPFAVAETPVADDAWARTWTRSQRRTSDAWSDDTKLERTITLPWLEGTGADVLASYLAELTVHTWDLATATGQDPDWDETVVAAALAAPQILPGENRRELFAAIASASGLDEVPEPFAEVVEVPADAPAIDRLVAWYGRDPMS